ncbi:uncharacterized protein LOC131016741 [Salvia miltiorrhiza]|uniref:uncharacterized protein LOC131016741 n=1 Tax=Salvia miltiorrhiza TaxID=226208 RepID=UPI0025AB7198|nr:uncharacterized protein LOC131016741 [Salvia miltiorrhiza]
MGSESPSAQYIHMVQHLIEECLVFNMSKEECMEALETHANIKPVITSTVWNELEKENKDFFEAYAKKREGKTSESESSQRKRIRDIVSDSTRTNMNDNDNDKS